MSPRLLTVCTARADDLADFNAAVDAAAAHNQTAIGYFRNGNVDLAASGGRPATRNVARSRPCPGRPCSIGESIYTIAMTDIATRLVTADMMLNMGHPDNARQALLGVRENLYQLRKSAYVAVLADCIRDANETMDKLMAFDGRGQSNGVDGSRAEYEACGSLSAIAWPTKRPVASLNSAAWSTAQRRVSPECPRPSRARTKTFCTGC